MNRTLTKFRRILKVLWPSFKEKFNYFISSLTFLKQPHATPILSAQYSTNTFSKIFSSNKQQPQIIKQRESAQQTSKEI